MAGLGLAEGKKNFAEVICWGAPLGTKGFAAELNYII